MSTRVLQFEILLAGLRHPTTDNILAGATVYFYEDGTTTAKNVYLASDKTSPVTSVTLDAQGRYEGVFGEGVYKLVIKDTDATTVYTFDTYRVEYPNYRVVSKVADYTATTDDDVILVDTSSGNITITMPAATTLVHPITVKKISNDANTITIEPNGSETIDGAANKATTAKISAIVFSNGVNLFSAGDYASDSDTIDGIHATTTATANALLALNADGKLVADVIGDVTGDVTGSSSYAEDFIGVRNGSFEIDTNADGTPDTWTFTAYTGGTITLDTTVNAHGSKCVKMVHPGGSGNGGGYAESDYVECTDAEPFILGVVHWATAVGMDNQVIARFYDEDQALLAADATLYSSLSSPVSATMLLLGYTPPTSARYMKIKLIGGSTSTAVAGTAYFDCVTLQPFIWRTITHPNIAVSEILATTTSTGGYADRASGTIYIPISGLPVELSVNGEIKGTAGTSVMSRLRIGSVYSDEEGTTATTYQPATWYFKESISKDIPATSITAGAITVYLQLYNGGAAGTVYQRINATSAATANVVTNKVLF